MERLDNAFRTVFADSRNPMLLFDSQRRIRDANAAATEVYGRSHAELLRQRIGDRTPSDLARRFEPVFDEFLERGRAMLPWTIVRPGDDRRDVLLLMVADVVEGLHLMIFLSTPPHAPGGLTRREREVVELLAEGRDGTQIAERLVLSPETVRTHIRNAMERVGAHTRAHLIAIAIRERLIEP